MLNQSNTQMPIAVRLYDNEMYGTTCGKGRYRKAVYNGTIQVHQIEQSYLVDYYTHQDWVNQAKTDQQMNVVANLKPQADTLYSWVKHYNRASNSKLDVDGVSVLDLDSLEVAVCINDAAHGVTDEWYLQAKPCRTANTGVNSPQLLATNTDLGTK